MKKTILFSPPAIGKDEIEAVVKTLKGGWLTMGPQTVKFEKKFAAYIGSKYAVAVNSCTSALYLSLKVIGIQPGDEVIVSPVTFASTANIIVHCGAKPIFCDIDPKTYNIDPNKIKAKITKKTKAIIPVHFGGQPCNMENIERIAKKYHLPIIEDAAHAVGARYKNKKRVGSRKHITCFSFYATKNLCTGEGGMITLNSKKEADTLKTLRLHGISRDAWKRYTKEGSWFYEVTEAGYKCNMTDINAAMGIVQLKKLEGLNRKRKKIVEQYNEKLKHLDVVLPFTNPKITSAYHLYPIQLENHDRNSFIEAMKKHGIVCSVHFIPLHIMPFYQKNFGYRKGDFPQAEKYYQHCVSLPLHPQLTTRDIQYVVTTMQTILSEK